MSNRTRNILLVLFVVLVAASMKSHGCTPNLQFPITLF